MSQIGIFREQLLQGIPTYITIMEGDFYELLMAH